MAGVLMPVSPPAEKLHKCTACPTGTSSFARAGCVGQSQDQARAGCDGTSGLDPPRCGRLQWDAALTRTFENLRLYILKSPPLQKAARIVLRKKDSFQP